MRFVIGVFEQILTRENIDVDNAFIVDEYIHLCNAYKVPLQYVRDSATKISVLIRSNG